ncbi:hypothetical protein PSY64_18775, partial [Shigella sonnei]
RNRSHWSTSKTPSYTKSVSWQHHPATEQLLLLPLMTIKFLSQAYTTVGKSMKPIFYPVHRKTPILQGVADIKLWSFSLADLYRITIPKIN